MSRLDPTVARLVDRQLETWELARRQRLTVPVAERPEVGPFLCISRMVGVDAAPIAAELARRLGWPVFDRELLDQMAEHDPTRSRLYATMDERDLGWWEQVMHPIMHGMFRRDDYFHRLVDTVLTLARQAPAIFVGRGADLLLPAANGFRVRLTASHATRIEAVARLRRVPPAAAATELARIESERRQFFLRHFRVEPDDPARHDLTLNVERWEPSDAAGLILEARRRQRGVRAAPVPALSS